MQFSWSIPEAEEIILTNWDARLKGTEESLNSALTIVGFSSIFSKGLKVSIWNQLRANFFLELGLARPRSSWQSCLSKMVVSKSHFYWKTKYETKTATAATPKVWHQSNIRKILRLLPFQITKEFLEIWFFFRLFFQFANQPTDCFSRLSPQHLLSLSQKLGEERRAEAAQMAIDAAKLFAKDVNEKNFMKTPRVSLIDKRLKSLIISESSLFS